MILCLLPDALSPWDEDFEKRCWNSCWRKLTGCLFWSGWLLSKPRGRENKTRKCKANPNPSRGLLPELIYKLAASQILCSLCSLLKWEVTFPCPFPLPLKIRKKSLYDLCVPIHWVADVCLMGCKWLPKLPGAVSLINCFIACGSYTAKSMVCSSSINQNV